MSISLARRAAVYAALADENRLSIVDALVLTDLTPASLGSSLSLPSNLLAHHLGILEQAGLIARRRSDGDGRRRYVTLVPEAVPGGVGRLPIDGSTVLFACRRNSARSQLAAALFRRRTGRPACSAGSAPATGVHPRAVAVAEGAGLELDQVTRGYADVPAPDVLVTVCDIAGEERLPTAQHWLHWSIADPVLDGRMGAFRAVMGELERRVDLLATALA